ncbi:MAG: YdeI/OmpD-associated family protein [Putridiphycobacter sp.]
MDKTVQKYFDKENLNWKDEQLLLRKIILETGLKETIKWGRPTYTLDGKNIVGLAGFKNHFGLWFFQGSLLKDKQKMLNNAQEGKTQAMRQWRFESAQDIHPDLVKTYVLESIDNHKQGLSVKIDKKSRGKYDLAPELKTSFEANEKLKDSFYNLTPGRQKEYSNHILEAKRVDTKLKRLEKITPMILKGVGLHDKYKNC